MIIINGKEAISLQDIARELNVSYGTIRKRIFEKKLMPLASGAFYDRDDLSAIASVKPKGFQPGNRCAARRKEEQEDG